MAAVTNAFVMPGAPRPTRMGLIRNADASCVDDDSCTVEELADLLSEVKSRAAEIKALEAKLTALNQDDSATLKKMLKAEECELNGFDGCSAWYYDK